MAHINSERIRKFTEAIMGCGQRTGRGKVGFDALKVREVVRGDREAAHRYVELHLVLAASQPGYLQPALLVAGAITVEFNDPQPMMSVVERARELGADDALRSIGVAPGMGQAKAARHER
jgi:hypothetical protein